jgi:hypothetical protein
VIPLIKGIVYVHEEPMKPELEMLRPRRELVTFQITPERGRPFIVMGKEDRGIFHNQFLGLDIQFLLPVRIIYI